MSSSEEQLKRIHEKLQRLLKVHQSLQKENTRLNQEIEKSKKNSLHQQKTVEDLRQQVDILKLNSRKLGADDKKELEKRINSYIKEIDRCIALLNE
ncbi:MAG: hypothetical protein LC128_08010 [Chitinophagales bacterium]|nr:hypothetical protein [Chitinophagales bacterium]